MFVARVVDESLNEVELLVSERKLGKFEFKQVEMPFLRLHERGYTILDTEEGQVFLHVNHYGDQSKYGNIYISVGRGGPSRTCLTLLRTRPVSTSRFPSRTTSATQTANATSNVSVVSTAFTSPMSTTTRQSDTTKLYPVMLQSLMISQMTGKIRSGGTVHRTSPPPGSRTLSGQ